MAGFLRAPLHNRFLSTERGDLAVELKYECYILSLSVIGNRKFVDGIQLIDG